MILRPMALALLIVAQQASPQLTAIDGSTIKDAAGVKYRLAGYDAPAIASAHCIEELNAGTNAKRRLQQFIDTGATRLVESSKRDERGRILATLYIAGREVGILLIAEGLARPVDSKPQNWCGTSRQEAPK